MREGKREIFFRVWMCVDVCGSLDFLVLHSFCCDVLLTRPHPRYFPSLFSHAVFPRSLPQALSVTLLLNRSGVYMKMECYAHAVDDCTHVLDMCDGLHTSCRQRRAIAYERMGRLRDALADYTMLVGDNADAALRRLHAALDTASRETALPAIATAHTELATATTESETGHAAGPTGPPGRDGAGREMDTTTDQNGTRGTEELTRAPPPPHVPARGARVDNASIAVGPVVTTGGHAHYTAERQCLPENQSTMEASGNVGAPQQSTANGDTSHRAQTQASGIHSGVPFDPHALECSHVHPHNDRAPHFHFSSKSFQMLRDITRAVLLEQC